MTEQIEKAAEAIWRAAKSNTFGAEPIWSRNWEDVHSKTQELYREMAQAAAAILASAPVGGDVIQRMRHTYHCTPGVDKGWEAAYHAAVDPLIALHEKEMVRLKELEGNRRFAIAQIPSDVWINSAGTIHVAIRILVDELAALKAQHEQEYKRCPVCDSLDMISSGPTKYICRHCHDTSVIEKLEAELSAQKDSYDNALTDPTQAEAHLVGSAFSIRAAMNDFMAGRRARASVSKPKQPTLRSQLLDILTDADGAKDSGRILDKLEELFKRRTQA